jgi:transcriptional regulator with XRE-family HTH domain
MTGLTVQQRVGMRVRAAREAARLTQQELAGMIGLARSSVANLEAGKQDITVSRLAMLAEVLKLDLADLIREGDLPPRPHDVTIERIYTVTCRTCAPGQPFDAVSTHAAAAEVVRRHIAEMRGTSGNEKGPDRG